MFGISIYEFLVIIIILVTITNPSDIPQIAKTITRYFFKAKNIIIQAKGEFDKVSKDVGLDDIKEDVKKEIEKEQEELKKSTIIDIYGNEHEVYDIENIRGDLAKEDLEQEIKKLNDNNLQKNQNKIKKS